MVRMQITEDQREELEQVSRQAVGRVALRAQMVLLAGRGYSVLRIAEVHDCGQDVVRLWLQRYRGATVHQLARSGCAGPSEDDNAAADPAPARGTSCS